MDPRLALLLSLLDQGYDHKAWHGPNLKSALRGITPEQAAWRPSPERHNVWEEAVHAAYWKYVVRRRILSEKRGSFDLPGSDWFPRPEGEPTQAAWRADRQLLERHHRALRQAVETLDPGELERPVPGSADTLADMIAGAAFHDVYHAGQIRLLRRMMGERGEGG